MDSNQKLDEPLGQSTSSNSRHIMWNLSEEDKEETFDSVVTYRRSADCKDPSTENRRASGNWQLLLRRLGEKRASLPKGEPSSQMASLATSLPELKDKSSKERAISQLSHESLTCKQSRDLATDRYPSISLGSLSSKLISDLIVESFRLPPQQSCVVREEAPKFAQGFREDSIELEVPNNSPVLDLDPYHPQQQQRVRSDLISVFVSAPTSSSLAETPLQGTSPIKRRSTTGKVATGTKGGSPATTATWGKKCASTSSGSTGPHLPNLRQRQQELHRYRVLIEQRRLDLLDLKIAREREEALQSTILFHKKLQIKECKMKAYEDNDCSNV